MKLEGKMSFTRLFWLFGFTLLASLTAFSKAHAQSDTGQHFYVVSVDFGTAPENFDRFKQIMNENAKASVSNEAGCREFNVYEVPTSPNHLFLFEVYDDEAAFQQHVNSDHYKHFNEVSTPIITSRAGSRGTMFVTYHKQ
jgi:(4S)-4-hydroxy-5-phosphonooxypentane-2,3-dione isomerase